MVEQLTTQLEQAKQSAEAQLDNAAAVLKAICPESIVKAMQVRSVTSLLFSPSMSEHDHLQHCPGLP